LLVGNFVYGSGAKPIILDRIYRINWIIIHRRVAENAEYFYLTADRRGQTQTIYKSLRGKPL